MLCRCHVHAGCASWRTQTGSDSGLANLIKPTPHATQTASLTVSTTGPTEQRTRHHLAVIAHLRSAKSSMHAKLETYLCKSQTAALSTRHDSSRVGHFCLQVALEDNGSALGMKTCMIATSPAAIHQRSVLLQDSITCSTLSVGSALKNAKTYWVPARNRLANAFSLYPTR